MCTILVYLSGGRIFRYNVENETKAREHVHKIMTDGYFRNYNSTQKVMENYPYKDIEKICYTVENPDELMLKYEAKV